MLVINGHIWHGGTENTSGARRRALLVRTWPVSSRSKSTTGRGSSRQPRRALPGRTGTCWTWPDRDALPMPHTIASCVTLLWRKDSA